MSDQPPDPAELATVIRECAGVVVDPHRLATEPELTFEALEVDSLGVLGIIAALENRYGVRLGVDAEQCRRPAQLRELLAGAAASAGEAADARAH